jgi:hypothetical protein
VFNIKEGEHDLDYIYNQRNIYNGTLINGYFSSHRLSFGSRILRLTDPLKRNILEPKLRRWDEKYPFINVPL